PHFPNRTSEYFCFTASLDGRTNGLEYQFRLLQVRVGNGTLFKRPSGYSPVAADKAERVRIQPDSVRGCFDRHTTTNLVTRPNLRDRVKYRAREESLAIVEGLSYLAPVSSHFLRKDRQDTCCCKVLLEKHRLSSFWP